MLETTGAVAGLRAVAVSPPMMFAVNRFRSTAVVTLHGDLDRRCIEALSDALLTAIDDEANQTLVVDLRDVGNVDPLVGNLFRLASGWARCAGVSLRVRDPAPSEFLQ